MKGEGKNDANECGMVHGGIYFDAWWDSLRLVFQTQVELKTTNIIFRLKKKVLRINKEPRQF